MAPLIKPAVTPPAFPAFKTFLPTPFASLLVLCRYFTVLAFFPALHASFIPPSAPPLPPELPPNPPIPLKPPDTIPTACAPAMILNQVLDFEILSKIFLIPCPTPHCSPFSANLFLICLFVPERISFTPRRFSAISLISSLSLA